MVLRNSGINGEVGGNCTAPTKEDPRLPYAATFERLTRDYRLRQLPMVTMSCVTQHANIRLINRRGQLPGLFRYLWFVMLIKRE